MPTSISTYSLSDLAPTAWYFVFCPRLERSTHFWNIFTTEEYHHVFAFKSDGEQCIVLNPTRNGILVYTEPLPEIEVCDTFIEAGFEVFYLPGIQLKQYIPRGVQTCVSICKALAGLKAWHVITPKQFYNYLRKRGVHYVGTSYTLDRSSPHDRGVGSDSEREQTRPSQDRPSN